MTDLPATPTVSAAGDWARVQGLFHRAVDPAHVEAALAGSRGDGRYAPAGVPTLYLSSSREGVAAAMTKYVVPGEPAQRVLDLEVDAERIADLRDADAMRALGVDPAHAALDWQTALAAGERPASWAVRERLEAAGAQGLIDPSRKAPGLWHLALFAWNTPGAPRVTLR